MKNVNLTKAIAIHFNQFAAADHHAVQVGASKPTKIGELAFMYGEDASLMCMHLEDLIFDSYYNRHLDPYHDVEFDRIVADCYGSYFIIYARYIDSTTKNPWYIKFGYAEPVELR